ncbi:MAG: acyltransferase [Pseudomonadota bacterium]
MDKKMFLLGYIPELDGLRGIAVLAVMLFHAKAPFMKGGFIGVDLFFVLSGFLITAILIREYDTNHHIHLKHFYLRRVLRLAPALMLLLLVHASLSLFFLDEAKAHSNLIDSLIALFYASNWARAFNIHPPDLLGHTWSLSIEEQFYILWPLMLLLFLRATDSRKKLFLTVVLLAVFSWVLRIFLASHGASVQRLYNGLDTRADALLIGCALGVALSSNLLSEKLQGMLSPLMKYATPLSALALIAIGHGSTWNGRYVYYWISFLVSLFSAILIFDVLMTKNAILKSILSHYFLVWTGSISYGLYLWHYPIYMTMKSYGFDRLSIITLGSAMTFLAASSSYYLMERPILKLKSRLSRARSGTLPGPLAVPLRSMAVGEPG